MSTLCHCPNCGEEFDPLIRVTFLEVAPRINPRGSVEVCSQSCAYSLWRHLANHDILPFPLRKSAFTDPLYAAA